MKKFSGVQLNKIAKKYNLAEVYIFGSQINGFQRDGSDFDIAVRFKDGLPKVEKRGKIYGNLISDLNSCFPKEKVDLVFIDEILLDFQFKVVAEGELIYAQDIEKALNFKENIINYYRDYKYFIDEYYKGVLETVGS